LKSHADARTILEAAAATLGVWLSVESFDLVQAVALLETGYGDRWKGDMAGSHNWGAQHAKEAPPCTPPHREGSDEGQVCFQTWPDDFAGAGALVSLLLKMRAPGAYLRTGEGDPQAFAESMQRARYFTTSVDRYARELRAALGQVRGGLGRPDPVWRRSAAGGVALLAGLVVVGVGFSSR
jgi:hypothetical protein